MTQTLGRPETATAALSPSRYGRVRIGDEHVLVTRIYRHAGSLPGTGEPLSEVHGIRERDGERVGWVATDAQLRDVGLLSPSRT
jgi:hypothetical protein